MSVLLAIISHPRDNLLISRHWKYFKQTGWPILGAGTNDRTCEWPEPVIRLDTGKIGKKETPAGSSIYGLVEQELDIWKYFLDHPQFDSVCVVEADNLFVRKPPEHPGGIYLVTLLPNCERPGLFKTPVYFSTPRWADRVIVEALYSKGVEMFRRGDVEHFISDRFPALICYRHQIPWKATPNWSPSVRAVSESEWISEARSAIRAGAWCLHSVKTQAQLSALKDLLPCL